MYLQPILLKIRKITLLICTFISSIMSIVFASFKHLELSNSIKISATILQIVYICMTTTSVN